MIPLFSVGRRQTCRVRLYGAAAAGTLLPLLETFSGRRHRVGLGRLTGVKTPAVALGREGGQRCLLPRTRPRHAVSPARTSVCQLNCQIAC